jgi:hypothetical protein
MKRLIATIFFLYTSIHSIGQSADIKVMVDSLQFLKTDTLDCSADLYWRIIAKGDKAIPFLIDKLTDTTQTNIKFHCKKTRLNVGEVAQFGLIQIADFPAFLVTKMQFDVIIIDETGEGCWSFYDFLFINSNKARYQKSVKDWYDKERSKYKAQKISKTKQTLCQKQYGIDTYYRWTE